MRPKAKNEIYLSFIYILCTQPQSNYVNVFNVCALQHFGFQIFELQVPNLVSQNYF